MLPVITLRFGPSRLELDGIYGIMDKHIYVHSLKCLVCVAKVELCSAPHTKQANQLVVYVVSCSAAVVCLILQLLCDCDSGQKSFGRTYTYSYDINISTDRSICSILMISISVAFIGNLYQL